MKEKKRNQNAEFSLERKGIKARKKTDEKDRRKGGKKD